MKLLVLAPEPFFEERGTPIAVRLLLEGLSARPGIKIDLITYPEGEKVSIPNVAIHRIPGHAWLSGVRPGASFKKIILDTIFLFYTLWFIKKRGPFDLIHAVEESVFIAWVSKTLFNTPYIYDMDSSLASQLTEKWRWLSPFGRVLNWFETKAICGAKSVVAVCETLRDTAIKAGAKETFLLRDISLLDDSDLKADDLRKTLSLPEESQIVMYVGNLERYQGIDLLIESFCVVAHANNTAHLVIVGGNSRHIEKYKYRAAELKLSDRIHFTGPRPSSALASILSQATILVSPRIEGSNTPMKIYSFLHSGKPVVATRLITHTQILSSDFSVLADATSGSFGKALMELLESKDNQSEIGNRAKIYAENNFTKKHFFLALGDIYGEISHPIEQRLTSANY